MPMLTVLLTAEPSDTLAVAVASLLTGAAAEVLGKVPALTAVAVQFVSPAAWFVGGRVMSEDGRRAAFVDIRVTDETNTKQEKAAFIAKVQAGLDGLLGPLHPVSYVLVHDVRAAAYGYGGRTQEARFHDLRLQPR